MVVMGNRGRTNHSAVPDDEAHLPAACRRSKNSQNRCRGPGRA
jgi:hypothetical protein